MQYATQIRAKLEEIEDFIASGSKKRVHLTYHHVPGKAHEIQRIYGGYETILSADTAKDLYNQLIGFRKGLPFGHYYLKQR